MSLLLYMYMYKYVDKCIQCVWIVLQVTLLNHSLTKQESSRVKCFPSYEIQGMDKGRLCTVLYSSVCVCYLCYSYQVDSKLVSKNFCSCTIYKDGLLYIPLLYMAYMTYSKITPAYINLNCVVWFDHVRGSQLFKAFNLKTAL